MELYQRGVVIPMSIDYEKIYNHDYFSGKNSFFYRTGYGDYAFWGLAKYSFQNLSNPIKKYLDKSDTTRILDVGCAYGIMLEQFPKNFQKTGIDVSSHAIDVARKRLPDADFVVGDAQKLYPFPKDHFDVVICNDVLEHVEEPEKVLENIWTVLKPHGFIYVTTPNLNFIRKTLFAYPDKKEHHISLVSHDKLLALLQKTGFTIKERWTFFNIVIRIFRLASNVGSESGVICSK